MKLQTENYLLEGVRFGRKSRYGIKDGMSFGIATLRWPRGKSLSGINILPKFHRQNVDLGLKSILEAAKSQNTTSHTKTYRKIHLDLIFVQVN